MKVETVTEHMLFSTVRLEAVNPTGTGSGTGFLFSYRVGDIESIFIVTNKHVVENASAVHFFFTKGTGTKPLIGQRLDVAIAPLQTPWHGHSDPQIDIAIFPLKPILQPLEANGETPFFRTITHTSILEPEEIEELDPLEQVIFLGHPNGFYDTANLTPIFRRGMTATPPQLNYCGRPTFLIDASVFGGSSGSPVFLDITHGHVDRRGAIELGPRRTYLLGILAAVHIRQDYEPLTTRTIATAQVPATRITQMLDLGIVFRASLIVDTVEDFLRSSSFP